MAVGSDTGPAQDATLQAIIIALGGPIVGMPNGSGTGVAQDASLQQILALLGGGSIPGTAHTVIGGATYTIVSTDAIILFDESNGMQPAALLPADAAHGLFIDRTIAFVWIAWDAGLSAQPLINGNGNNLVSFSGMPASATYAATTTISTPGAAYTLKWDGADWVPQ